MLSHALQQLPGQVYALSTQSPEQFGKGAEEIVSNEICLLQHMYVKIMLPPPFIFSYNVYILI